MTALDLRHPGLNLGTTDPKAHRAAEELVLGFWVFLMSDLVLFATYATMIDATAGGPGARDVFELGSAAIETGVLLCSSFTFGMASLAMKYDACPRRLLFWLAVTLILGLLFVGLELRDFLTMFAKGAIPSRSGFPSAFFVLVPTHGLHVIVGSIWIMVMIVQVLIFGIERDVKLRILRLGLFWHFLDLVWIGIFSVVYLQGLA